ncbi:MAG: ThiF family adenylyltransferase [Chloroflexota bacterium]
MSEISFSNDIEGRYDRHQLILWWDQKKISQTNIIVAGAGALGNEVLKLLALVGVGRLTVIDFDVVARSNLARMVLFREQDVGRPKVTVAAERLGEINPEVQVRAIQGDLRFDIGLGDLRDANLVIGCLDSVNARWALNRKCMQAGVEWIDGGISDFHGLVTRYSPSQGACYECNFTANTLERFNRRYSCPFGLLSSQAEEKVPTTALTTSAIAALQVQQALMMLHGIQEDALRPGERVVLYLKPFHLVKDLLPYNPDCLAHARLPGYIPVAEIEPDTSALEALRLAQLRYPGVQALALGYDYVTEFYCHTCQSRQPVHHPKARVQHMQAACPRCGELREPLTIASIQEDTPEAGMTLREFGIPEGEILTFSQEDQLHYLAMSR